jgi:hypothetical protein
MNRSVRLGPAQGGRSQPPRPGGGHLLGPKLKTIVLRVHYAQQQYYPDNVLEERIYRC